MAIHAPDSSEDVAGPSNAKRKPRATVVDELLAAGIFLAGVLYVFRMTVEDQLARLRVPGGTAFTYGDLHGPNLDGAFKAWRRAKDDLRAFEPVSVRTLILQRSAVAAAFFVLAAAVMFLLLHRKAGDTQWRIRWPDALVGAFVISSSVVVLMDLSVVELSAVEEPGEALHLYDGWFPLLDLLPFFLVLPLVLLVIRPVLSGARKRWKRYRASPASTRLVLGAAVLFLVLCSISGIGAQLEDLLRRDFVTDQSDLRHYRRLALPFALACYVAVLWALSELVHGARKQVQAKPLIIGGTFTAAVGLLLMWTFDTQSAPFMGGVMVLVLGLLSWRSKKEGKLARRSQMEMRLAGGLVIVGVSLLVLGLRFGDDAQKTIVFAGVVSCVVGLATIGWRLRFPRLEGQDELPEPADSKTAATVVAGGIAVMVALPHMPLALNGGAVAAVVGALLLLHTRREFRSPGPALDGLGTVPLFAGIALLRIRPDELTWLVGAALAGLGLVWLRLRRGSYVPSPADEGEGRFADGTQALGATGATVRNDEEADADGTGVLVLAGMVPIAGLLIISVRVLGSVLASGNHGPPLALLAFQAFLLLTAAVVGWFIGGSSPRTEAMAEAWKRTAYATLVLLALPAPIVASAAMTWWESAPAAAGRWLGPIAMLVLALASVGAAAGVIRLISRHTDQPAILARLGFRRTPIIGLVLTWFALVVVVGSPIEPLAATSHDVRTLPLPASEQWPASCDDQLGVLNAIESGGLESSGAAADELCRWANDVKRADDKKADGLHTGSLPLVLITASGGGVRAAAWTTRVLDCLLFADRATDDDTASQGRSPCPLTEAPSGEPPTLALADRWPLVFAAGGTSGGSIGVATAAAEWLAPVPRTGNRFRWARMVPERDHVAPVSGQMLAGELGLAGLGIVPEHDRAETLIDDWSEPFGAVSAELCEPLAGKRIEAVGFLRVAAACPANVPLLLFNGTIVRTGGRFDISPLDAPGEADGSLGLRDVLCQGPAGYAQDVPFFDAAFLSARFPLVTPSGRLGYRRPDRCEGVTSPVDVVDGGYHENSGAAQVAEMWKDLRPVVVAYNRGRGSLPEIQPILLQIVNQEINDDTHLGCLPTVAPDASAGWSHHFYAGTTPTPVTGADFSVRFGEPLRVAWAGLPNVVGNRGEKDVEKHLARQLCADRIPVVTMVLYQHPGRALPLGWSLTHDIVNDLEDVLALEPNACRARAFAAYVDAPAGSMPGQWTCGPCDNTSHDRTVVWQCSTGQE